MTLTQRLKAKALDLGFDLVAVAPVAASPDHDRYRRWLEAGYAGEMGFLARHLALKQDPRQLLPEAQSLVLVGLVYARPVDPALRSDPGRGQIAAYALGQDYHDVMRPALIELDGWLRAQTGRETRGRACVDSAPLLERSWAMQAGLGFPGKNTCLIHPDLGSWFFLGGLLIPEALHYDEPPTPLWPERHSAIRNPQSAISPVWRFAGGRSGTCGACTRCLDVCPTGALVSPFTLDARLCISYLTIELRGEMPLAMRPQMGNWVFGCDLCQDVCPWNRDSPAGRHPALQPAAGRVAPPLTDLLALDQKAFDLKFRGSAVRRAKWEGFLRNVCVAAGNWGDPAAAPGLQHHLYHSPPLVAVHAAWALGRLHRQAGRPALLEAEQNISQAPLRAAIAAALTAAG